MYTIWLIREDRISSPEQISFGGLPALFCDIHVHSSFSTDSDADMEAVVREAISRQIDVLCFTDHIDWNYPVPDLIFDFDKEAYFRRIADLRNEYGGKIRILGGVELGMQPGLGKPYADLLKQYPFDFVIGSQHLVNGMDPYYPETFETKSADEIYRDYFEETFENVKEFHSFDSMGHLDYIVRYGKKRKGRNYSYKKYAGIIDEILKLLVRYNIALELNTCGLRKQLGAPNPRPEILRRYRELGGTLVTIGSDAHKPLFLGYAFNTAKEILKTCGFTHFVYYEDRKPKFELL